MSKLLEENSFRKSSFSNPSGSCVEAGIWNKATFSHQNGGCVEATLDYQLVLVRDTKISRKVGDAAPVQSYSLRQWQKLISEFKTETFTGNNRTEIKFGLGTKLTIIKLNDVYFWLNSRQTVVLEFNQDEMDAFSLGVKAGEFDLSPTLKAQLAAV